MPVRVVDLRCIPVQQRETRKSVIDGNRKPNAGLVLIALPNRAMKALASILNAPQTRLVNSKEIQELIATGIPEAQDGFQIFWTEVSNRCCPDPRSGGRVDAHSIKALELHLGSFLRIGLRREVGVLALEPEHRRSDILGKQLDIRVVLLHGF